MGDRKDEGVSRREVLAGTVGGVVVLSGLAAGTTEEMEAAEKKRAPSGSPTRQPVVYLPHGGGPWPFVSIGMFERGQMDGLTTYLRSVPQVSPASPRALLVVSAHWEESIPTVMTAARPELYYDYYGFPPESYRITWPAPGAPDVAARVRELLAGAGFKTAGDGKRGFDHGTFIPLKVAWPEAEIPTLQLSLVGGLDPRTHLDLGKAIAPLRDEGVLIIGSGMSFHNLRAFTDPSSAPAAEAFDAWLQRAVGAPPAGRDMALTRWAQAPHARFVHPREEHLLPLMVVAGAAGQDRGRTAYQGVFGQRISAFHFSAC